MQDGQYKRGGLSCSGLGDANDIVACDHLGDDLFLDRGGVGVAFACNGADEGFGKAELSKCFLQ